MKKSLILLPLTAMLLSACALLPGGGGKKSSSSASGSASGSGSNPSQSSGQSGSGGGGGGGGDVDLPTAHGSNVDLTAGEHTFTYDFVTGYADIKEDFPYVQSDTGLYGCVVGNGLAIIGNGCFVGSYNNSGYLMMKNKDGFATANGNAFIGNCVTLGAITKVEITIGSSASTAQKYYITFSKSYSEAAQTTGELIGTEGGSATASASDGYGFFTISTSNKAVNGQLGSISVTYTI